MKTERDEKVSDIEVLYEDEDVVVVNKPAGVIVHGDGRTTQRTVVDWFLSHTPGARGVGEPGNAEDGTPLERSGVVHRLDRETSGVLILAKHQDAFIHLKAAFHDRHAQKEYRALVYGSMREPWGTIDRPIGRSSSDFRLRSAQRGARGQLREATTNWQLIHQNKQYAYLRVMPLTGRTHQIRVHLKAIGRPVVGDPLYAPESKWQESKTLLNRLALHAYQLTITLPNGKKHTFTAPLPQDFEQAAASIAT